MTTTRTDKGAEKMKQYGPQASTPTDIKFRTEAYQRMLAAEKAKVAAR